MKLAGFSPLGTSVADASTGPAYWLSAIWSWFGDG
jgi:hypothetical protein